MNNKNITPRILPAANSFSGECSSDLEFARVRVDNGHTPFADILESSSQGERACEYHDRYCSLV
jgi:hypothetical protein